jgi:hypothetical protein
MANFNKKISDTNIRIGEVRFGYVNVFAPRKNEDGTDGKYSVQVLIPKTDAAALALIQEAIETAKKNGVTSKWNGKMPVASKLKTPLRDGDEEFPEDDNYKGMYFLNASTPAEYKPGVRVLENGVLCEALTNEDFYSGCWGCVTLGFFPYNTSGNTGIACGLNNVIKTRDGERLAGGRSADADFSDLAEGLACLD